MASQRDILIVGSVPLADSEAVFRAVAGALGDRVRRIPDGETGARINWIESQSPVFEQHDDAYFAPLQGLAVRPETRLYLGLIHFSDGVEGSRRRLAAASKVVEDFGLATECGFGRRAPETIPQLLKIHAAVADDKVAA